MSVGTARTVALQGTTGHLVDVQVDLSDGLIATVMVGRADVSINEARDRCKAAIGNTVFDSERRRWPNTKRVTISLSPADLPKRGSHFDVAIAVAVLAAADASIPPEALRDVVVIGELTLDGRVRCVPGVLPMVMAAKARGVRAVVVPEPQVDEARMVEGLEVWGVRSLGQVIAVLAGEPVPEAPEVEAVTGAPLLTWRGVDRIEEHDMADVIGIPDTRFAVEVAAAGGHHLHLTGPKGSGKSTVAERISGLLPDLDPQESLELTAVHSLGGALAAGSSRIVRPPYRFPHHSASRSALLGGGSGRVRPGEVSKAHLGVLFLDEFPLFPTDVIEALREPLESGEISIARGEDDAVFPARAMLVVASNPCRCGEYHPFSATHRCTCSELSRREYRAKVSGPIADRIDITRYVEPPALGSEAVPFEQVDDTATVRARVTAARLRQAQRHAGLSWRLNAHAPGPWLRDRAPLSAPASAALEEHVRQGRLTRRGGVRVHRIAWTLADLAGLDQPGEPELEVALLLRAGAPLSSATLRRRLRGRAVPA